MGEVFCWIGRWGFVAECGFAPDLWDEIFWGRVEILLIL